MPEVADLPTQSSKLPLHCLGIAVIEKVIALAEAAAGRADEDLLSPLNTDIRALSRYLERLSDGSLAELMALMWLGRSVNGDPISDFADLVDEAYCNLENGAEYLAAKLPLADYLRRGQMYLREVSAET